MLKIIAAVILIALSVGAYAPAPIVLPDGVTFDPNDAPSPVMGAYSGSIGIAITGEFDVYSEIAVAVNSIYTTIGTSQVDPNGTLYTYSFSFTPSEGGIYYDNIVASNAGGKDERTIVFNILKPPVITGCRRSSGVE